VELPSLPNIHCRGCDLQKGSLRTILSEYKAPEISVYAIYPETRHLSIKVRVFIDFLVERFGGRPVLGSGRIADHRYITRRELGLLRHTVASSSAIGSGASKSRNGIAEKWRKLFAGGAPATHFCEDCRLGRDHLGVRSATNAALTALPGISCGRDCMELQPAYQVPVGPQPIAPISRAAAKRCLMASLDSDTGGS